MAAAKTTRKLSPAAAVCKPQKQRKFSLRKFYVPAYIKEALETLRPPDDITVSEWAERERVLDEKSSSMPGHWRNSVTPYLVGIMDELNNWATEKVIFCKPTQVGGTECINNAVGYAVDQDPGPTMIVEPNDELAESYSDNRLMPMFKKNRRLWGKYHRKGSTKTELQFDGMYISLCGSNSPSDLASKPIRYLFLDEVDKYPGASKKEADPVSLAIERTKTFNNRKIYLCSTPTLREGRIWREKEAADAERHFFVPCKHCGEMIELKFAQLKWPSEGEGLSAADRADLAYYVCQECGAVLADADKPAMLQKGEWRDVRRSAGIVRSVAFWMSTMYSPFTRFSEIAAEFLRAKEDPERLHNFTNSWLAEPWEDTRLKTSAELVAERASALPEFTVPAWAKLLTAGVDVQENCCYLVIRAWGDFLTSQLVTRRQVSGFAEVEQMMNLEYVREDGGYMLVDLCLVDSGDQTDDVYEFAAKNSEWCLPCKGTAAMLGHYKLSTVNRSGSSAYGMTLVLVDGGRYKDAIAGRMRKPNGKGSWMVFKDIDLEYCQQVTAEHKIQEMRGGKPQTRWVQKTSHADNHYLDCEVYAFAAADVLGVRSLFLQEEGKRPEPRNETVVAAAAALPAPDLAAMRREDSWIKTDGSWL